MIRFVYDFDGQDPSLRWTRQLIDSLVDPILVHLPEGRKASHPAPDALNVRFWTNFDRDVFINHGISDKNYRNADAVGHFPYIFHSGPRWQRKYLEQGLPASKLRQVGYTKMDPLFGMTPKRHIVLWAPTMARLWRQGFEEVASQVRGMGIEQSFHCLDVPHNVTTSQLVDADVVIADGGSTIYEAWALGKPVVFTDYAVSGLISPGSIEADIYGRQIGYHVHTASDLERVIDDARTNGITQAERDFIDDVFPPELRGTSGKAHAEALRELAA